MLVLGNIIDDNLTGTLERGLDYASFRQQVIANNVANINTPRFRRSDVPFSQVMRAMSDQQDQDPMALGVTDARHFPLSDPMANKLSMFVSQSNNTSTRLDGNNVDINKEMADSAKNGLYQQALTQMMARRFRLVKDVIKGR